MVFAAIRMMAALFWGPSPATWLVSNLVVLTEWCATQIVSITMQPVALFYLVAQMQPPAITMLTPTWKMVRVNMLHAQPNTH